MKGQVKELKQARKELKVARFKGMSLFVAACCLFALVVLVFYRDSNRRKGGESAEIETQSTQGE